MSTVDLENIVIDDPLTKYTNDELIIYDMDSTYNETGSSSSNSSISYKVGLFASAADKFDFQPIPDAEPTMTTITTTNPENEVVILGEQHHLIKIGIMLIMVGVIFSVFLIIYFVAEQHTLPLRY